MLVFFGYFHLISFFLPELFSSPDDSAGMMAMKRTIMVSYPHKSANR
uniref:Uncharacterized protein n=1 Tax=Raoultella ornithinolytica TaxID=54291 RepID=A0A2H4ZGI5_RAOOR|nr:Hypothetical protein [Raoultella ornithinolytica]